jgi:acetyl esterase/lipase
MKRTFAALLIAAAAVSLATAQRGPRPTTTLQDGQILPLWPNGAPGALGKEDGDVPTMTVYLPRDISQNMAAVIVCPGGGYEHLSMNQEGRQVASLLNSLGMTAVVLKYRLGPRYHHPIELGDAQRAIRMLRAKAAEYSIGPDRIGIMGFSAGGHLAVSASTHFDEGNASAPDPLDRPSSRPDFAVLGYPVVSMTAPWTHMGSKRALLGDNPDPELAKSLSGENAVTARTPITFIFQTNADTTVPAENSVEYFLALRRAHVKAEMHVFENGPHGVGLALNDPALSEWSRLLANWFRVNGLLK